MNRRIWSGLVATLAAGLFWSTVAEAVPSFSRQTNMPCEACHTSYPELTQFGRMFKLNGYQVVGSPQVETGGSADQAGVKVNQIPPFSAMFLMSYQQQAKGDTGTQNSTMEFPQQFSLFFAGEISPKGGAFVQLTYDHVSDHFTLDNTDIRFSDQATWGNTNVVYGVNATNNPTAEDIFQSTPAWGFPFVSPDTAKGAPTALIDGGLAGDVVGLGAYTMVDNHYYLDVGGYRSEHAAQPVPYSGTATNTLSNVAPYVRLAYQTTFDDNFLEVGAYGMPRTLVFPTGVIGPTDEYRDVGVDAQYERHIGKNQLTVRATALKENTDWKASAYSNAQDNLQTYRANAAWHVGGKQTWTLGYSVTTGKEDALLYTDSTTGSPNTNNWMLQYTYLPWQNVQVGAQYTAFTKFMGASSDYNGTGRNASDNNATYVYAWLMW